MTIRIHNQLFIYFLPGDVSNVIIGIGVGSAVLSMAGTLIVMVMMCVYTIRKKGSGYIQGVCGGQSLLLTLGPVRGDRKVVKYAMIAATSGKHENYSFLLRE